MEMSEGMSGWVAGLLAAAVTVGFTAWWDSLVRRRGRLDDAVTRLEEAASYLWFVALKTQHGAGDAKDLLAPHRALAMEVMRVRGLAWRPAFFLVPARWVAPARYGLGLTVSHLGKVWRDVSEDLAWSEKDRTHHTIEVCLAITAACAAWTSKPRKFWPGRDISGRLLARVRSDNGDLPP
ncbi:hypothetical protein [Isoptericola sp. NPDC056605]|uniref:hypothetical protein n=1 Tax=Isoptericola sp. NPDC056605 TaxID=3345876 RepID=UPI0036B1BE44